MKYHIRRRLPANTTPITLCGLPSRYVSADFLNGFYDVNTKKDIDSADICHTCYRVFIQGKRPACKIGG